MNTDRRNPASRLYDDDIMKRSGPLVVLLAVACGSSANYEKTARELVAFVEGTSVFGPTAEFGPSPLPEVAATGLFPTRPASECEIAMIAGGEDSFALRMALLARAKKTIRIQALIFTGDESGLRVSEVLKQKKLEGVEVKVIVDSVNNMATQTQWMYFDLMQHGIQVHGYQAMGLQLVNEILLPFVQPHADPNKRYHEKIWLVDAGTPDAEAVMGGLNIANEYFRVDPGNVPRYWRDQDVLVRGAVLADLTTTFDRNYEHFVEQDRQKGGVSAKTWVAARELMKTTGAPTPDFVRRDDLVTTVAAFEARTPPRDYHATQCRFFQSRPRYSETYIQQAYLKMLDTARDEVLIGNAYFVPTHGTRIAIAKAARKCVRIVLLSNGAQTNDTPGINVMARAYYSELLLVNESSAVKACKKPAGVEIWEWEGKKPTDAKQSQGLYHAKYMVVDHKLSLVGSYNLDPRSERLNSETAIVFENAELSRQLMTLYAHDLSTSRRISAKEAGSFERPASARHKLTKDVASLFEDAM